MARPMSALIAEEHRQEERPLTTVVVHQEDTKRVQSDGLEPRHLMQLSREGDR